MQSPLDIRFHPIDLREHGTTPSGLPLYRIVWADSRIDKAALSGHVYELPRYEASAGKWILEKFQTAKELTNMTPEEYEALLKSQTFGAAQMPYPTDGDYELCYVFAGEVEPHKAHTVVSMIEFGRANYTDNDRKVALAESVEKKAFDAEKLKTEIIQNAVSRKETPYVN